MTTEQMQVVKIKDPYCVFADMAAKALTNFTGIVSYENDGTSQKAQVHYLNGKFHREDGPAVVDVDYNCYYFLNGEPLTEEMWRVKVGKVNNPKKSKMKTNREMFVPLRRSIETISQKASDYIEKYSAQFELEMEDNHLVRILVNAELCGELSVPKAYAAKLADALKDKFTALGYVTRKTLLESDDDNNCYSYSVTARIDYEGVEEELAP